MGVLYYKLLFSLGFLFVMILNKEGLCISFEAKTCPTWNHLDSTNSCTCGDSLGGVVDCYFNIPKVIIKSHYCMFLNKKNSTLQLIGSCPYGTGVTLPSNASELINKFKQCSDLHRKGRLCGECEDNYSLPVYSYSLGCVHCKSFKYGWIKFITVAFFPLTVFYILVIIFRISATSSTLNGYVLTSQMATIPTMIQFVYTGNEIHIHDRESYSAKTGVATAIAVYAIWNLDFFRSFYSPICLHPHITYPQVLLLDYAVAVYPMLLIFITYILVKMHDNYAFIVKLWRPFHRCLVLFRKQWNIQSSLVNALATFIVLSYVKILNVSFQLLMPSHVYNMYGETVNKTDLYYNGSITMTSKAYRPYLAIAVLMLLIFNVIPLLLLAVYPSRYFQKILNDFCGCCQKYKIALHIFMDAFQGCYEDTSNDFRYFAAYYLSLRFLNLLFYVTFNKRQYFPAMSLLIVFTLVIVTKLQPYKNKRSNTLDVVYLFSLFTGYTSTLMQLGVHPMIPNWAISVVMSISVSIPMCVIAIVAISNVFPKAPEYFAFFKTKILERCRVRHGMTVNEEEQPILKRSQDTVCHAY